MTQGFLASENTSLRWTQQNCEPSYQPKGLPESHINSVRSFEKYPRI